MSTTGGPLPAPAISRSNNTSKSSTSTIISALSVTQDVVGLVPIVGGQLQSLCTLALRLAEGLENLKEIQEDERKLMEKVQDVLRIFNHAKNDERALPLPELKYEIEHVESSLSFIEFYLKTRANRSLRQRITTFISQKDSRNATQCREHLESAIQRFQLVCLIKIRLELDSKVTELKGDVVGQIKRMGQTIVKTLHSSLSETPPLGPRRNISRRVSSRSTTPIHAGQVRSYDEFSGREEDNPSKRQRVRRRSNSSGVESPRQTDDWELPPDSGDKTRLRSISTTRANETGSERDISPLPRKRRRSSTEHLRRQQHARLGVIDENAYAISSFFSVDTAAQPSFNVRANPLETLNARGESKTHMLDGNNAPSITSSASSQTRTLKRKQEMYFRT